MVPGLGDGAWGYAGAVQARLKWRACGPYAVPWPTLVTALATSAPMLPEILTATARSAAEAEAEPGRLPEDCTRRDT